MNKLQKLIYNEGERLIPYISHNNDELVRHRSSYVFFYNVILSGLIASDLKNKQISIVDLGFGCGYGCSILSRLSNAIVTGVDISPECEIFAQQNYARNNVKYVVESLENFIPKMSTYDYVVSRGVLEHVENGLNLIQEIKFDKRIMIDVPYNEAAGNEHHILTGIQEDAFLEFENCEIFYEDLDGAIYTSEQKPDKANMILVVISNPELPKVSSLFDFPILPITETTLESENKASQKFYYDSPSDLLTAISKTIKETDVVLDIGCGIRPMTYFKPKIHLMIEPYQEYVDMLSYKFTGDKSAIIFCKDALLSLQELSDGSVDSVFLLDVIEHMEKDIGRQVIQHCERVAREQIVLFTPLGFMPQRAESNIDAWGLSGGQYQEHLSGWEPDDFKDGWHFHICKNFHNLDLKGDGVEKFYGAFFAIKNIVKTSSMTPATLDDITIPFFSVNDAEKLYYANIELQASNQNLQASNQNLQQSYTDLINSRGMRMIGFVRSFLNIFRLKHKVV